MRAHLLGSVGSLHHGPVLVASRALVLPWDKGREGIFWGPVGGSLVLRMVTKAGRGFSTALQWVE